MNRSFTWRQLYKVVAFLLLFIVLLFTGYFFLYEQPIRGSIVALQRGILKERWENTKGATTEEQALLLSLSMNELTCWSDAPDADANTSSTAPSAVLLANTSSDLDSWLIRFVDNGKEINTTRHQTLKRLRESSPHFWQLANDGSTAGNQNIVRRMIG
eukprot:CAMPEP_0119019310 /NCGR_PEP_ID=MMETSP1176-20130426/21488_1 /TAXON_ID=265551 /ORGANISM="Synedropsis recta cf, Strain CCMP1620" /LENGTH=157 /DNA_ID=CAMNT_0006973475 /DNA_START=47 /DNA_END=517 /DNA_ORIENTATION=+